MTGRRLHQAWTRRHVERRRDWDRDPISIGVTLEPIGATVAMVEPGVGVVGLGIAPYPTGTVVDGEVRRPDLAAAALGSLLDRINWPSPPAASVAVDWVAANGHRSTVEAPIRGPGRPMTVRAVARHVDTALATLDRLRLSARAIDSIPVAVARLAATADPGPVLTTVWGGGHLARWQASYSIEGVRIEAEPGRCRTNAVLVGRGPGQPTPLGWGRVPLDHRVAAGHPEPGVYSAAVGAALGVAHHRLTVDFAAPSARRIAGEPNHRTWTVEAIR